MAESDLGEKTESATPRRRREVRKQGNIAKSMDLTAALSLAAALFLILFLSPDMMRRLAVLIQSSLAGENASVASDITGVAEFAPMLRVLLLTAGPFALLIFVATALSAAAQVGWSPTAVPLQPKLNRLDPISGLKKFFSMQTFGRAGMSMLKVIVLMVVSSTFIHVRLDEILALPRYEFAAAVANSAQLFTQLFLWLVIVLIIMGILDFAFQKWQWERQNKMSKQEVKEELKSTMGSPENKQRQRAFARKIMNQRLQQSVPTADVVVTNPEHLSIALKWNPETMNAPVVVAKGADYVALRIRQIAAVHQIPIVEKKPLARAMYPLVEPGQEIPSMFFQAVAEILAFVYRLNGKTSAA